MQWSMSCRGKAGDFSLSIGQSQVFGKGYIFVETSNKGWIIKNVLLNWTDAWISFGAHNHAKSLNQCGIGFCENNFAIG